MSILGTLQYYYIDTDSGYDEDGEFSQGALVENSFIGTIQPLNSKELANLEVGEKDKGRVKVYSTTQLPISRQGQTTNRGALILFDNKYYRVHSESIYSSGLIDHYKYIAVYEREFE